MAAWFYQLMGEEVGPVSSSQIRKAAVDRRIQPDSLVRREGSSNWVSADRIRGLFDDQGIAIAGDSAAPVDAISNPITNNIPRRTGEPKSRSATTVAEHSPDNGTFVLSATADTSEATRRRPQRGLVISDHLKFIILGLFAFSLVVVAIILMGTPSSDLTSLGENPSSNIPESIVIPPTPQTQKDPVKELRAYAGKVMESCQSIASTKRFMVAGVGAARLEIDSDFFVDVKKSDSLISPYIGEIRINRRIVYDNIRGIKGIPDKWQEVVIECRYENEQWLSRVDWDSQ